MNRLVVRFVPCFVLLLPAADSRAQDRPAAPKVESEIRDVAKMFDPDATAQAEAALKDLERESGVPVFIESIESLGGEPVEAVTLRRAQQSKRKGVYILLAKADSKLEVIVSKEFQKAIPTPARAAIRETLVAEFKDQKYDEGLNRAVTTLRRVMPEPALTPNPAPTPVAGPTPTPAAPNPGPEAGPPLVVRDQVRLNLAGARRVLAGAEAKAATLGVKSVIAVVDEGGHLLAFARLDGARPASVATALTKAISAATFRQATGPQPPGSDSPDLLLSLSLQDAAAAGGGRITALQGGVPIIVDGQPIGAVGVAGGSGDQDATIARSAIADFQADLKAPASPPAASPTP